MKLRILSDIHLEHGGPVPFANDGLDHSDEVLVLAGDIICHGQARPLWEDRFRRLITGFRAVVYVPGNHEYYGADFARRGDLSADLFDLAHSWHVEFHDLFLRAAALELDGQRFVGRTLWFPRCADGLDYHYKRALNDFHVIRNFDPEVYRVHETQLEVLDELIQPGDVVVTHHLPHPKSVAARYVNDPLARFFLAADAAPLVETRGAKLWIHGHTHTACDYVVGSGERKTQVVCNPHGYPNALERGDRKGLLIEI